VGWQRVSKFLNTLCVLLLYTPPNHLLLYRSPNIGPLVSRWELDKFIIWWNKMFRTSKILTLLYQQFSNLLITQRDMSGSRLRALSNNRWWGGSIYCSTNTFASCHQKLVCEEPRHNGVDYFFFWIETSNEEIYRMKIEVKLWQNKFKMWKNKFYIWKKKIHTWKKKYYLWKKKSKFWKTRFIVWENMFRIKNNNNKLNVKEEIKNLAKCKIWKMKFEFWKKSWKNEKRDI
jgi:hypothetical protein